ncbi:MAG TPA: class I SAM-dependent methyltransferase [Pyrinomonadaceae bacterium]|nr:class I SAM-dependent methyltransferase [Pyrinomonadaceae bacterium]
MSSVLTIASRIKGTVGKTAWNAVKRKRLASYLKSDRRPWREGYYEYREKCLGEAVVDQALLDTFAEDRSLPPRYAYRLDARLIEIPWVLSRVRKLDSGRRFLDAGSAFNYDFVLTAPALKDKQLSIVTLAPEGQAFWQLGVSYLFGDLRDLDLRDNRFDAVACISTIEHIGMDNTMYAEGQVAQRSDPSEFLLAVKELKRVLKPGGVLYISFPFGRYENHGWFQQFDAELVDTLIEAFAPAQHKERTYQYHPDGWQRSTRESCKDCEFFDVHTSKYSDPNSTIEYPPDYPAGERGLACLELVK